MGYENTQQAYAQAVGTTPTNYPWIDVRDPTSLDINYKIGKFWINTANDSLWYLNDFVSSNGAVTANWISVASSLLTLSDDSNTVVSPSSNLVTPPQNIQLEGTSGEITVTADVANHKLVFALAGGSEAIDSIHVDAHTAPGTDPVLPDAAGLITITGSQVATGTIGANVIRTDSLAANTFTIEIQRTTAVAATDSTKNGVCHFNSADFSVDSNGFVTALATTVNYTNVTNAMSPYTVISTDYYISVDCSGGAVTLNFPNAPTFKRQWIVKDRTGSASTNNISITTPGGIVTLDGLTTYTMNSNYQAINLIANSTPTYEVF